MYYDSWPNFAPDFRELQENEEHIESEDEFDEMEGAALEERREEGRLQPGRGLPFGNRIAEGACLGDTEPLDLLGKGLRQEPRYFSDDDEVPSMLSHIPVRLRGGCTTAGLSALLCSDHLEDGAPFSASPAQLTVRRKVAKAKTTAKPAEQADAQAQAPAPAAAAAVAVAQGMPPPAKKLKKGYVLAEDTRPQDKRRAAPVETAALELGPRKNKGKNPKLDT